MNLFAALLIGLTSATFAQPSTDQRTSTFNFNQANLAINLDQKDFQTIYRTDQVPATCYRDEIQGTRTVCHTEYNRQCHNESYQDCRNVPRRECSTHNVCRNVPDKVCNSHGCTTINRRVCSNETSCRTTSDRVCRTENRQVCQNVPYQVCQQVPNVVKVPYSCMQPIQVPIGQELKLHTVAKVAVTLVNFNEVGPTGDVLVAQLNNGIVSIASQNPAANTFLYQKVGELRSEQQISQTEKVVTYTISVAATSIAKLNAFLNTTVSNPQLFFTKLQFNIGEITVPLKGHLKIVEYWKRRAYIIIDADFSGATLVGQAGVQNLAFNAFGVNSLEAATHLTELSLRIDLDRFKLGLLNPGALVQVADKAVFASFEAFPAQ